MIDMDGNMYVDEDDIIELMLQNRHGKILPRDINILLKFDTECKKYNITNPFDIDVKKGNSIEWNMPIEYRTLDIRNYIKRKIQLNTEQIARVDLELQEFESRGLIDMLRFLTYMVNVIRSNNIIYGVGRGSSISSYVLFLLGVHRVDSFRFKLDIREFLK